MASRVLHNIFASILISLNETKILRTVILFSFCKIYGLQYDSKYKTLRDFFKREEKQTFSLGFVSPCEGKVISSNESIIKVKGETVSLRDKNVLNIYLSPENNHNVYAPCDAYIRNCYELKSAALPVFPFMQKLMPNVLNENKKTVLEFESEYGPFKIILVGSFLVNSIELCRIHGKVNKGDRLANFNFGSSVVLCLPVEVNKKILHIGETLYDKIY